MPFLRGHHVQRYGEDHHRWKGGRITDAQGYILLRMPDHPQADPKGYVREHRFVMEQQLGRPLQRNEHVHHMNHDKGDNRPENLMIIEPGEHSKLHAPARAYDSAVMREVGYKGHETRWGYVRP